MAASESIPVTFLKKWGTNERGSFGAFAGSCKATVDGMVKAGFVLLGHKDLLTVGQSIPKPQATPVPTVVVPAPEGAAPVAAAEPEKRGPGRPRKV